MIIPAKKSLGQNFLVNEGVAGAIARAAGLTSSDTVVEVGPGTGNLTRHLVAGHVARLILIEKDQRLIAPLQKMFGDVPGIEVVMDDVLTLNPAQYKLRPDAYKIVANLPYYITAHFFKTIFEVWPRPALMVIMVQKEVAQRIVASPPHSNLLGLSVQLYTLPEIIMRVSAGSFRPIPGVDSAVVRLVPRTHALLTPPQEKIFFQLARAAFAGKRKKLSNTLAEPLASRGFDVGEVLRTAKVDPAARPQHLTLDDWVRMTLATENF